MTLLAQDDEAWAKRLERLIKENKTLRYIASISDGKIKIAVEEIGQDHPFFNLSGPIISSPFIRNDIPLIPWSLKEPGRGQLSPPAV